MFATRDARQRHLDQAAQALAELLFRHDAENAVAVASTLVAVDADAWHDAERHLVRQFPLAGHAQRRPHALAAEGARAAVEFRRQVHADRWTAAFGVQRMPAHPYRGVAVAGFGHAPAVLRRVADHAALGFDPQLERLGDADAQQGRRRQRALAPFFCALALPEKAGFELHPPLADHLAGFDEIGAVRFDVVPVLILGVGARGAGKGKGRENEGVLHGVLVFELLSKR
ncbi:hypothetical protein MASSI9I_10248 [Massilia sp. 9I]|nr:hypothetical protein MASSI9I_10248 [Massilia sp. 9I]